MPQAPTHLENLLDWSRAESPKLHIQLHWNPRARRWSLEHSAPCCIHHPWPLLLPVQGYIVATGNLDVRSEDSIKRAISKSDVVFNFIGAYQVREGWQQDKEQWEWSG